MPMLENIIQFIHVVIAQHGAWGVFVATLLEEVIAPIPSPIVSLAGGFFLIAPNSSLLEACVEAALTIGLPVALGISMGSSLVYGICFFGGKSMIERYGKLLGLSWADVEKAEERLVRGNWDEVILLLARVLPILPGVAVSALCGIIRYRFVSFLSITFVGAFIRAFFLGIIGWKVGELYESYADTFAILEKYGSYVLIILAFLFLIVYLSKAVKQRRKKHVAEE